ncbi:MAG: hypothetical protein HUU28_11855 [Planctomycetaceae bacterium]|nr:hypothetical protein [Planctomycetaceae bacterium]
MTRLEGELERVATLALDARGECEWPIELVPGVDEPGAERWYQIALLDSQRGDGLVLTNVVRARVCR